MTMRYFHAALSAVVTALSCALAFAEDGSEIKLPDRGICSHRGAQTQCPENTVPAFAEAVRQNAAMIELDVDYTKDGKILILHDSTVDRTSNGKGKLRDLTFDQARALDFGAWKGEQFAGTKIPTLEEALEVIPKTIWLNIHVKPGGELGEKISLEVADIIAEQGRMGHAFLACDVRDAEAVHARYPEFLICNMERQGGSDAYIDRTIKTKAQFIQRAGGHPTPQQIARLKDAGIRINYFGTNDPKEIIELFDLGVDFPLVDNLPVGQETFKKWSQEHENK